MSKGLNNSGVKAYGYNDYIKQYLKEKGKKISYYNYSDQGISISELNNDLIYLKDKVLKEYLQTSDLIILSIGENEIQNDKTIEEIEYDLSNLVKLLKRYNNNICLLGHYYLNDGNDQKIKKMNDVYKKIAKNYNLVFINMNNIDYFNNNNIYPSQRGYREIGKLIIKSIEIKNT